MEEYSEYVELSLDQKLDLASSLILDAPPGEVDDVIADISGLVDQDELLEPKIAKVLLQYNEENFETVKVNEHTAVLSQYNKLPPNQPEQEEKEMDESEEKQGGGVVHFVDYELGLKFQFDALAHKVDSVEEYAFEETEFPLRSSLQRELNTYVKQHFNQGLGKVFPCQDKSYALVIVAKKLSKNNFWNGRWKTLALFNPDTLEVEISFSNLVHYYEEGNVQLNSQHKTTFSLSPNQNQESLVKDLMKKVAEQEQSYQVELNKGYTLLNESAFKGLRRSLPYTRSKLDWNQIVGYKLGMEVKKDHN